MEIKGVKIEGTFDVERWFDTIARLLTDRGNGVQVDVTVTPKDKNKKSA